MGWFHWTEDGTLDTSMHGIQLAYEGHMEMLKAIFGSSEDQPPNPGPYKPTLGEQMRALAEDAQDLKMARAAEAERSKARK